MFCDRFDTLLKELDVSSKMLSEFMNYDKSYINRIRAGGRNVRRNSRAAAAMVNGVFQYAKDNGLYEKLCLVVGTSAELSDTDAVKALEQWLFEGVEETPHPKKEKKTSEKKNNYANFSEKFKAVMTLSGLSNIRLSRLLNVDASLASRWRSGFSSPATPELQEKLCSILLNRVYAQNKTENFAKMLSVPEELLSDPEKGFEIIKAWLFASQDANNSIVESLLTGLDNISFEDRLPALPFEKTVSTDLLDDKTKTYTGNEGLRKAVLRFLGNVVRLNIKELWLYSDQSMDWMTEDKEFLLKWFSLMLGCLKNGTKIKIIHNIDRGFEEMTAAIKSWLPLYMTGNIQSYYSTKPNGSRFTNTIFLAPDNACIYGSYIAGQSEAADYGYFTDKDELEKYKKMYTLLMQDCRELIKIDLPSELKRYNTSINEKNGVHVIQNTLSLATMPETLAERLAKDNKTLLNEWELQRERYRVNLQKGFVYEYIPLPDDEALFKKSVPIDTTLSALYYTPEDFSEHIENIIVLAEKYDNYKLIILPDKLLYHSRLIVGENSVTVEHLTPPKADFVITHPLMRTAFAVYVDNILHQYGVKTSIVTEKLREYL